MLANHNARIDLPLPPSPYIIVASPNGTVGVTRLPLSSGISVKAKFTVGSPSRYCVITVMQINSIILSQLRTSGSIFRK